MLTVSYISKKSEKSYQIFGYFEEKWKKVTKFSGRVSDSDSSSSCFLRLKEEDEAEERRAKGDSGLSSKNVAADISASIIWPEKKMLWLATVRHNLKIEI